MPNKKHLALVIAIVIICILAIFYCYGTTKNGPLKFPRAVEPSLGTDVCTEFPKTFIKAALQKEVIKTEEHHSTTTNTCAYYMDESNFVTLRANNLNVENQKAGQIALGRTISANENIKMPHFVVVQSNGLINEIVLVINPSLFLAVDRSSIKAASDTELATLAVALSERIIKGENVITADIKTTEVIEEVPEVPVVQNEDIVRNFFTLIQEGKISEAVNMMSKETIADDAQKQAWGVQFNSFEKLAITAIEPAGDNAYKVTLDVKMKPEAIKAPIPNYGYDDGENLRWVSVVKEDELIRIVGISTGP